MPLTRARDKTREMHDNKLRHTIPFHKRRKLSTRLACVLCFAQYKLGAVEVTEICCLSLPFPPSPVPVHCVFYVSSIPWWFVWCAHYLNNGKAAAAKDGCNKVSYGRWVCRPRDAPLKADTATLCLYATRILHEPLTCYKHRVNHAAPICGDRSKSVVTVWNGCKSYCQMNVQGDLYCWMFGIIHLFIKSMFVRCPYIRNLLTNVSIITTVNDYKYLEIR